jgi:hypothetical protein
MIKTQVTWNPPLTNADIELVREHAQKMANQEKTDGTEVIVQEIDKIIVERPWYTVEYAEEWLSFVQTFNPKSAIIINE